ncbi:hypothetical protein NM208_g2801 [Fusarium decemcellulare]|uniref:Uncharacterized protein n=1 Tax=Fusarium decemcellulare TaxID=57161 RepID=A0ACC1SR59_9HYPO|nr:hypothetical protein NM208_g2801 [Fusarium decemcellulare]
MASGLFDEETESGEDISRRPRKQAKILSKACESCKLKKSKCDSSRPQCDVCVYKEKGQPGLRRGYGKAVENRLSTLEDNVDKISQSIQDILQHLQTQTSPRGHLVTPLDADQPQNETPVEGHTSQHAQTWQPEQTSASEPLAPDYLQPVADTASYSASPSILGSIPTSMNVSHLPNALDPTLPPEPILHELIDLFFDHIYPWAPMFHKQTFKSTMFSPERQILLHGIVVLSFRFWWKTEPSTQARDDYVKVSRKQLLLETVDVASLNSTQALALLAIDAIGQGPGPRCWNIMAMLVTSTQQLHLAKVSSRETKQSSLVDNEDSESDAALSTIEAEEKKRLFWTIYSLDRFSSVPLAQTASIDSRTIKLQYPASDDVWGQNVSLEWFQRVSCTRPSLVHRQANMWQYYIDILTLVDHSNQLLIQPVNLSLPAHCQEWQSNFRRLDMTLLSWFERLPADVRQPPDRFDPMWTMVHATFYLASIRMYTVAAFPSTASPYLRPSSSARGRCRQAVRSVACLAASLEPLQVTQLGPMFAFIVWVAARSLVIIWTSGYETTYGSMPPSDLDSLLAALRHSANNPGGPTGLDIFNDTRRTAYGLQSRLGTLAGLRGAVDMFSNSDDFLDGFAELIDLPASQPGFGSFEPGLDGDWL